MKTSEERVGKEDDLRRVLMAEAHENTPQSSSIDE